MYPRLGRHNSAAYWPLLPTPLFRLFRRERPFYCSLVLGSHVTTDDIWAPLKRRLVLLQTKWKVLLQTKWEVGTKPGFDQNLSRSLTTRSSRAMLSSFVVLSKRSPHLRSLGATAGCFTHLTKTSPDHTLLSRNAPEFFLLLKCGLSI